ncbi:hypothetical protein [Mucilaginibacter agri]|uniref:RES domain-containing protein n=1 Tax=Mucilaginibacter agri TaxID=2695265 RepID=A0A965ZLN9_9SPHI|nr:hypothetical protein [Mucilaginibacter agri]NCD72342.1 hypothetical protein [Mucilaginibacter agri]
MQKLNDLINKPSVISYIENNLELLDSKLSALKALETKELDKYNFQKAIETFYSIFARVPLLVNELSEISIMRSRKNMNGEIFSNQQEISYNIEKPEVIGLGRFNRIGEPLFYGSLPTESKEENNVLSCVLEGCKELSDKHNPIGIQDVTVGKWKITTPLQVINLCVDDFHLQSNPEFKQTINKFLNEIESCFSEKAGRWLVEFYKYISLLNRTEGDNLYYLSVAMFTAMKLYYRRIVGVEINGIMYTSAMTEGKGLNIVLSRKSIDNCLTLDIVVMYRYFLETFTKETYLAYPISSIAKVKDRKFMLTNLTINAKLKKAN